MFLLTMYCLLSGLHVLVSNNKKDALRHSHKYAWHLKLSFDAKMRLDALHNLILLAAFGQLVDFAVLLQVVHCELAKLTISSKALQVHNVLA